MSLVWIFFIVFRRGRGRCLQNGINSNNFLLHLQAPVRTVAQVSLPSVLWMVSPATVLEEDLWGSQGLSQIQSREPGGQCFWLLKEREAGLQKPFKGQAREFDSNTSSTDILYMKARRAL